MFRANRILPFRNAFALIAAIVFSFTVVPAVMVVQSSAKTVPTSHLGTGRAAKGQAAENRASKDQAGKDRMRMARRSSKKTLTRKHKKKRPVAAKRLFGAKRHAAAMAPQAIGFYTHGCLAGGVQLPATGPAWQAMRLSRNRNWGHPALIKLIERLATDAKAHDGWNGLLVGDLAQPRGGPMLSGHHSHQVGLDADVWLRQMPNRVLSRRQREKFQPISMLKNSLDVNPKVWTDKHLRLIKRAASYPQVERIFVNRAIKYKLCKSTVKGKRGWLSKVRPWAGHYYHMHIRIKCPVGSIGCKAQTPPLNSDGCAYILKWHRNLKAWLARPKTIRRKKKKTARKKRRHHRRRLLTMARLPARCRAVLNAKAALPIKVPQLVQAPQKVARPGVSSSRLSSRPVSSDRMSSGLASSGLAEARSILRPSH